MIPLLKFQLKAFLKSYWSWAILIAWPILKVWTGTYFSNSISSGDYWLSSWFANQLFSLLIVETLVMGIIAFEINSSQAMKRIYITKVTKYDLINSYLILFVILGFVLFLWLFLLMFCFSGMFFGGFGNFFTTPKWGATIFGFFFGMLFCGLFSFLISLITKRMASYISIILILAILCGIFKGYFWLQTWPLIGLSPGNEINGFTILSYIVPTGYSIKFIFQAVGGYDVWAISQGFDLVNEFITPIMASTNLFVPIAWSIVLYVISIFLFKETLKN